MAIKFKQIEGSVDLSNYYTKEEVDSTFMDETDVDNKLEDYYTKTEVDSMVGSGGNMNVVEYMHYVVLRIAAAGCETKYLGISVRNLKSTPITTYDEVLRHLLPWTYYGYSGTITMSVDNNQPSEYSGGLPYFGWAYIQSDGEANGMTLVITSRWEPNNSTTIHYEYPTVTVIQDRITQL